MEKQKFIFLCFLLAIHACNSAKVQNIQCDVIIAGGSASALAAALSSASEGAKTCLLEPTDWVGGQLTASAVSAIDFAWHTLTDPVTGFVLPVGKIDKEPVNQAPNFMKILASLTTKGRCWVSDVCYPPKELLDNGIYVLLDAVKSNLRVFYNTVVKKVNTDNNKILSIVGVERKVTPSTSCGGYDIFPSKDLEDWYSEQHSKRYKKTVYEFSSSKNNTGIFVDATDWGEVLALSGAPYLQGIDEQFDGDVSGNGDDTCGQSIVFDFVEEYHVQDQHEKPNPYPVPHPEFFSLEKFTWDRVWTYRRILSSSSEVKPKDLTLQNWGRGNDYAYGYLFLSKNETAETVRSGKWAGGVDLKVMDEAERNAIGYHYWYKSQNASLSKKITLNTEILGTCHGLAKLPYIRDTRRSIGMDDFVMKVSEISGNATNLVGYIYKDRIATGAYDVDYHGIQKCKYPEYMKKYYPILPYFIPYRALTNKQFDNLIVTGKTMAQSFLVNSATRLHPVEWTSGTAGGVVAAFLSSRGLTTREGYQQNNLLQIQKRVKLHTPIQWTINGTLHPSN